MNTKPALDDDVVVLPRPRFTFDKIFMVSTTSKKRLEEILPVTELQSFCQDFIVRPTSQENEFYRADLQFTYRPEIRFWNLLLEHEAQFGIYRFYRIELAFDFPCPDEAGALALGQKLAFSLRKPWHRSGRTEIQIDPDTPPRTGIVQGPTFYFEERRAGTGLKVYARFPKYGPRQNQPIARVEWTLKRARNILSKTGIAKIEELLSFSQLEFFERWFRLEKVDFDRFGRWLLNLGRKEPNRYWPPERAVRTFARGLAVREFQKMGIVGDETCDNEHIRELLIEKYMSPAVLRGEIRARRKAGRPRFRDLTDYRINKFFRRLQVQFDDE